MRIANLLDRAVLIVDGDGTPASPGRAVDVERASDGRFGPSLESVFEDWRAFAAWAGEADLAGGETYDPATLGPPVPRPNCAFRYASSRMMPPGRRERSARRCSLLRRGRIRLTEAE